MKSILLFRIFALVASIVLGAAIVRAEDLGAIKARMEQRQGTVDALKEQKLVGENNRGYLEARASLNPEQQAVVSNENSDRAAVYAAIAAQTNTTSEKVGRLRATKIATSSKGGVWVQTPEGEWIQKH